MLQVQSAVGFVVFLGIAFLLSPNKSKISKRMVATGIFMQMALAFLVLGIPVLGLSGPLHGAFDAINQGVMALIGFTSEGSRFLFSDFGDFSKSGSIFAFQVLPIIVFISSLMAVLYHIGLMQWIVYGFAVIMQKTMGISGAESLAAAANVFVGQTEAPLVIKPYLEKMTASELFSVMTGGMATVAGGVLAAYFLMLKDYIPNIGGHLLTASILSAPAALMIAKIMLPEEHTPETLGRIPKDKAKAHVNVIEAAAEGASEGVMLAINVAGMLLAFIALIAMADSLFGVFGVWIGFESWGQELVPNFLVERGETTFSLSLVLSWLFTPIAFFLGIPSQDLFVAGSLLGKKVVFNEFISYLELAQIAESLHPRTLLIMSYALCGFANFSSIAIQIGGIGSLVPKRKSELALMGIRAVIGGSLAAFLTACWAGILN